MTSNGKVWSVWAEGYAATGESGEAFLVGRKWAATFERACELIHKEKGEKALGQYTPPKDGQPPAYWGCRLYDNEADARRTFG